MTRESRASRLCAFICLTASTNAVAQGFEAADVHVSSGIPAIHMPAFNTFMRGGNLRNGIFEVQSATMLDLIRTAYGVDSDKVADGPDWLNSDQFDVFAKAPDDTDTAALRPMLQALLADRFGLIVHRGTKPLPGFALIQGSHLQLKQAAGGEGKCETSSQNGQRTASGSIQTIILSCRNMAMTEFANQLPRADGDQQFSASYLQKSPVMDLTGLAGSWSFTLRFTARNWLTAAGSDGVSLSDAIEKQLGLKLEQHAIPTSVIVVDKVNRRPTANSPEALQKLPVIPTMFDVADIKPTAAELKEETFRLEPGGLVELRGFTLTKLIKFAWEIADLDAIDHDELLIGGPKWTERFDIVAKAGTASPSRLDIDTTRTLLRALLHDRFGLITHMENRTVSVDALTAVRPKLKKADPSNHAGCRNAPTPSGSVWTFTVTCMNTTMAQFAEDLSAFGVTYVPHPVIDATGLEGGWDFTFGWSPPHLTHSGDAASANDPNGGLTIIEALEKQLGLKVELRKHSMPVLVIDHAERQPTDN